MTHEQHEEGTESVPSATELSRRTVLLSSGLAGAAGLTGLASGSENEVAAVAGDVTAQQAGDFTITYIPHASGASDPFWAIQEQGWNDSVSQLGVDGQFQGPSQFDPQQQVENIQSAISAGVDGIATSIVDPDLFEAPLQQAAEEGIPVLAVNIPQFGEKTLPYQGYVGNDETEVGRTVAQRSLELFQQRTGSAPARAVIPNHQPGNVVLEIRIEGIRPVLEENGVPFDVISTSDQPAQNISALESYRRSNQNLDLVITLGPSAGEPALTWLNEQDLTGEIFIGGVDITEPILQGIRDGPFLGTAIQQPYLQGYLAAQYLTQKLVNGIIAPSVTPTGPSWVDQSNLSLVEQQIEQTGGA